MFLELNEEPVSPYIFGPSKNLLCYQLLPDAPGLCFTHKVGL